MRKITAALLGNTFCIYLCGSVNSPETPAPEDCKRTTAVYLLASLSIIIFDQILLVVQDQNVIQ